MADRLYPQLPPSVWHSVRQILKKSPKRKLDDGILSVELGVQLTAARAYFRQLVILGLLAEDGAPTELADRWRQDDEDAINDILINTYPTALLDLAPRDQLDRTKIVRWFTQQGYGSGAANNKAATYILIAQPDSPDQSSAAQSPKKTKSEKLPSKRRPRAISAPNNSSTQNLSTEGSDSSNDGIERTPRRPTLAVNVQIHISADASSDQIDSIFSAMKRYFDDAD